MKERQSEHELLERAMSELNSLELELAFSLRHTDDTRNLEKLHERIREIRAVVDQLGTTRRPELTALTFTSPEPVEPGAMVTITRFPQLLCRVYAMSVSELSGLFWIDDFRIGIRTLLLSTDPISSDAFVPEFRRIDGERCKVSIAGIDPLHPLTPMFRSRIVVGLGMPVVLRVQNRLIKSETFEATCYLEVLPQPPSSFPSR